jgi:oligoribonuclease (3'-5' exoribonuclease)
METSAADTFRMSQLRHTEMSCAKDIQERLVDMDILSKDLSTCVDEYKLAYFRKAKENVLKDMDNPSAQRHQSEALSQLDNSFAPNQLLALSCFGDTENQETSLVGGSKSQEICEGLNEEVDEQDIEREDDVHGACDDIDSSIEPLLLL